MDDADFESLTRCAPAEARAHLLALIARLSDAEAAALWALICSWAPRDGADRAS